MIANCSPGMENKNPHFISRNFDLKTTTIWLWFKKVTYVGVYLDSSIGFWRYLVPRWVLSCYSASTVPVNQWRICLLPANKAGSKAEWVKGRIRQGDTKEQNQAGWSKAAGSGMVIQRSRITPSDSKEQSATGPDFLARQLPKLCRWIPQKSCHSSRYCRQHSMWPCATPD